MTTDPTAAAEIAAREASKYAEHLAAELARVTAERDTLRELVADLADEDPCWFDHHGYCQAHGWMLIEPRCPYAQAKELLTTAAPVLGSPAHDDAIRRGQDELDHAGEVIPASPQVLAAAAGLGSPAARAQEPPCYDCGQREADHVDGRCSRYRPAEWEG